MPTYALVTGASRGIGYYTALELIKQPDVVVLAVARGALGLAALRSEAKTLERRDAIIPIAADLSTDEGLSTVLQHLKDLDAIHTVVLGAGALVKRAFAETTLADWQHIFDVNVFSVAVLTQKLLPWLTKAEGAHVVFLGSRGGYMGSRKYPGLAAYSASKGAVGTLAEVLAEELAPQKIAVNCLALGAVQTEMFEAAFPGAKAPLTPQEMGAYVAWFAQQGHHFFNGKILPVSASTP